MPLKTLDNTKKSFLVNGHRVVMFTPIVGEFHIKVPWEREHWAATQEQVQYIEKAAMCVLRYCVYEGFLGGHSNMTLFPMYQE